MKFNFNIFSGKLDMTQELEPFGVFNYVDCGKIKDLDEVFDMIECGDASQADECCFPVFDLGTLGEC